jgi:hypothetical protein
MPAIETGQVKLIRIQTSRIRSLVDGKVAIANNAQKTATIKPALAQIAIRSFMVRSYRSLASLFYSGRSTTNLLNIDLGLVDHRHS